MASLAAQIIDQRINGIVERQADSFAAELGLGADAQEQRRSTAFTFLVARTVLVDLTNGDLTDDDVLDGIVDGGNDFGVDALYFSDEPDDGAIPVVLIQSKYRRNLDGAAAFPENGIARMIDAISDRRRKRPTFCPTAPGSSPCWWAVTSWRRWEWRCAGSITATSRRRRNCWSGRRNPTSAVPKRRSESRWNRSSTTGAGPARFSACRRPSGERTS